MILFSNEELVYLTLEESEWQGRKTYRVNCGDKNGKIMKFPIEPKELDKLTLFKPFIVSAFELKQFNGQNTLKIVEVTC